MFPAIATLDQSKKGNKYAQKIVLATVMVLIFAQPSASAEPPPPFNEPQERLVIEACVLSIRITLTREDGGNTPPVTKIIRGTGSIIGNISMRCIWQPRDALLVYTIKTVHKLSNGKTRTTTNDATLKC